MDEAEFIERYMILMLGASKNPLPSVMHFQKEMFLLSKFKMDVADSFNFEKHYFGPFSQVLNDALKSPAHFSEAFNFDRSKILLTEDGRREFDKMIKNFSKEEDFKIIVSSLELLRSLYDRLSETEIMFLIYETYPEYTEFSKVSDRLLKNKFIRDRIIKSIFSKGLITEERYEELKHE
ncbi:MAG: hypothetical protein ABIF88_03325 [archaeon]